MTQDCIFKPPLQAHVPTTLALQLIPAPSQGQESQSLAWAGWEHSLGHSGCRGSPQCQACWHSMGRALLPVPEAPSRITAAHNSHHCPKVKGDLVSVIYVSCTSNWKAQKSLKPTDVSEKGQSWAFPSRVKQVSTAILQLGTDQPKQEQLPHIFTL